MTVSKVIDDSRRSGIGKGLLGATGGIGCERQRFYQETVRDELGHRLRFPKNEATHFGAAVDAAHAFVVEVAREDEPIGDAAFADAIAKGMAAAMRDEWSEEVHEPSFRFRVETAILKLIGALPNATDAETKAIVPEGIPLTWMRLTGVRIQGDEGESLKVDDPVSGRLMVGTPDYLYGSPGEWTGWLDVKTTNHPYRYPDQWTDPEVAVYDYMLTLLNGGELPTTHAYMEYVRAGKPYWTYHEAPVTGGSVTLAALRLARWRHALAYGVDALDFTTRWCAECPFSTPIEGIFGGCEVGMAALDVMQDHAAEVSSGEV